MVYLATANLKRKAINAININPKLMNHKTAYKTAYRSLYWVSSVSVQVHCELLARVPVTRNYYTCATL